MVTDSKHKDALLTLQNAGISKTSQRLAVLDILLKATTPLSVNTIRQVKANVLERTKRSAYAYDQEVNQLKYVIASYLFSDNAGLFGKSLQPAALIILKWLPWKILCILISAAEIAEHLLVWRHCLSPRRRS